MVFTFLRHFDTWRCILSHGSIRITHLLSHIPTFKKKIVQISIKKLQNDFLKVSRDLPMAEYIGLYRTFSIIGHRHRPPTSSWSGCKTLTNWNGQKGGDFSKSSLIWVGNWQKKKFSPRALRDIAILKLPILPYSDTMVIGHSVPLYDNQLDILWLL